MRSSRDLRHDRTDRHTDHQPSRERLLEVILDRPKANAIDLATGRLMRETFRAFRDDDTLRVAILRAAGEKFFSAGWDSKSAAGGDAVDAGTLAAAASLELPKRNPYFATVDLLYGSEDQVEVARGFAEQGDPRWMGR